MISIMMVLSCTCFTNTFYYLLCFWFENMVTNCNCPTAFFFGGGGGCIGFDKILNKVVDYYYYHYYYKTIIINN